MHWKLFADLGKGDGFGGASMIMIAISAGLILVLGGSLVAYRLQQYRATKQPNIVGRKDPTVANPKAQTIITPAYWAFEQQDDRSSFYDQHQSHFSRLHSSSVPFIPVTVSQQTKIYDTKGYQNGQAGQSKFVIIRTPQVTSGQGGNLADRKSLSSIATLGSSQNIPL